SARRALLYLGRVAEALAAVAAAAQFAGLRETGHHLQQAPHALCLAYAGRKADAQAAMGQFIERYGVGSGHDESGMPDRQNLLEAAVLLEDREAAALIMPSLAGFASNIDGWYLTCIARHLGAVAALLGDKPKALAYDQQALDVAGKVRF